MDGDSSQRSDKVDAGHPRFLRDLMLGILGTGSTVAKPGMYRMVVEVAWKDRTVRAPLWLPHPEESEPLAPDMLKAARSWFRRTHPGGIPLDKLDEVEIDFKVDDVPEPAAKPVKKRRVEPEPEPAPEEVEAAGTPHTCLICTGCELYQCDMCSVGESCDYCDAVWNHFANCV